MKKKCWIIGVLSICMTFLLSVTAYAKIPWPTDTSNRYKGGYSLYTGHNGMDISATEGTVLYAPYDGTAYYYQRYRIVDGKKVYISYGNYVKLISTDEKTQIDICHMSKFTKVNFEVNDAINAKDYWKSHDSTLSIASWGKDPKNEKDVLCGTVQVKEGEVIGYSGSTGRSTGSHLHITLYINGQRVDPYTYFDDTISALDHSKIGQTETETESEVPKVLKFNKKAVTVKAGIRTDLSITKTGITEELEFVSSNPDIVSVSADGKITGKKCGTANITVKAGEMSAKCKVTVKLSIKLSASSVTIHKGMTKKLTLTVRGAKPKVRWKSENSKIAMVDKSGKITAKKVGTTKIIAVVGEYTVSCKVTVKKPAIQLNKESVSIQQGSSFTLKATVKGKSKKVTWSSSSKKIATVKNGKVTAKKAGIVTITAKANGVTAKCKVTVKAKTAENTLSSQAKKAYKQLLSKMGDDYKFEVINLAGAKVPLLLIHYTPFGFSGSMSLIAYGTAKDTTKYSNIEYTYDIKKLFRVTSAVDYISFNKEKKVIVSREVKGNWQRYIIFDYDGNEIARYSRYFTDSYATYLENGLVSESGKRISISQFMKETSEYENGSMTYCSYSTRINNTNSNREKYLK